MAESAQAIQPDAEARFEALVESVVHGHATLGEIKGITDNELEAVYTVAYNLYRQNRNGESEKLFRFLCLYGHLDKRFWMGLGACLQQQQKYEEAVQAYSYMAILDVENPHPPMHAAFCYLALNDLEKAESGIEAALHWAGDKEQYSQVRAKAELLRSVLQQKKEGLANGNGG
ncbi:SycD/LcrH family type III secretion system chaperone [Hahella sp. KA22]|uniref:SycD/LcrH family type III secretion system chaperone n=1 Tax=unclassified Hahella TaxID=2624107 RepID=UPI000FDF64BF|nr:SycD/LcrH family type III secretion system chaperone [Hahella sp. KA22]AZZ91049.1 CesD/SycD/LcrH family type III secretion system chaperone [Hahella sp. KA22]QAY54419.1 CesD/SycD/LcrH family type III secretion system chaperone [Hahella sp. KA22]